MNGGSPWTRSAGFHLLYSVFFRFAVVGFVSYFDFKGRNATATGDSFYNTVAALQYRSDNTLMHVRRCGAKVFCSFIFGKKTCVYMRNYLAYVQQLNVIYIYGYVHTPLPPSGEGYSRCGKAWVRPACGNLVVNITYQIETSEIRVVVGLLN